MSCEKLLQSNKGFTLAEICVVFVLISVLASITTFSLMTWSHESQFDKAEQNAELIYMAVKNKIAMYKANGTIDEVIADISKAYTEGQTSIYICCKKEDYKTYKKLKESRNQDEYNPWAEALFDFVGKYIYDKTVLNAYVLAELDKETGNVLKVYYSDRTDFYNLSNSSNPILNEYKDYDNRYDKVVGFYSPE